MFALNKTSFNKFTMTFGEKEYFLHISMLLTSVSRVVYIRVTQLERSEVRSDHFPGKQHEAQQ